MSDFGSNTKKFGSIRTEVLVAYIFAILVVVGWIIGLLVGLIYYLIILGILGGPYIGPTFIAIGLVYSVVFLVMMIPSILVMRRTGRMNKAIKKGDVTRLKELNSVGWAIVALIFTGVISGIMLLIAHGPIEELSAEEGIASSDNLDKLIKLKSLVDSGIITKEEFERQKNGILHPDSPKAAPLGPEEDLKRLKNLLDSGVISQTEYDEQKSVILNKMISK
ncbi:MAG: SHOCT domain-containing protein [Candidatus Thermoplasmatota archaeon]|nr:SHOCT domain-containing protein [Candidatus Thermoplasmatota archaeon]MCL6002904.1 SHOCT domain-containing protein [Candidatus Thermoplasmatota archaeon]